jgi:hypothetical protein
MLPIQWTSDIQNDPKAKKALEEAIYTSTTVLKRLKEIIEEKLKALDHKEYASSSYREAGWSHEQAHINGQRATLTELNRLLTI